MDEYEAMAEAGGVSLEVRSLRGAWWAIFVCRRCGRVWRVRMVRGRLLRPGADVVCARCVNR